MATLDHKVPGSALRARIDERFFAPFKRNTIATRSWFLASVTFVLVLHGAILGYFLYRDARQPPNAVKQEETPVEVVVAPPPPPPPPQQQAQSQQQEIEKPASSAPRAESDTDIDTQKLDPETHAPKADTPPQDGQPQPKQDAAEADANPTAQDDKEAAAPPPDILKDDEEALDKAAPTPKPDTSQAEKATVAAKAKPAKTARKQFAGLSDLPDYKFARKTKKSLVSGGTEDSRYLAIVYGLITRNLQASGKGSVTVSFELDDDGDVVGVEMTRSSGDPLSDAEVVNAVRRTSPFPPPPPNRPHGLTATINFDSIGAARPLAMGAR